MSDGHRPGPWAHSGVYVKAGEKIICELVGKSQYSDGNGRLIAAAPDLLLACQKLLEYSDDPDRLSLAVEFARETIAKAEGK